MKRLLLPFLFCCAILASCDIVEAPYKEADTKPVDTTGNGSEPMPPFFQKVLLEDYTGMHCGNCPLAADEAKRLHNKHHDSLVVMAVHAGYFAEAKPGEYDFRTSMGDELDAFFKFPGYPNGMVNRVGYPTKKHVGSQTSWGTKVAQALSKKDSLVAIKLEPSFDAANRTLSLKVVTGFLKASDADAHLSVYLVEDSVVKYQLDYVTEDNNPNVPDYVHMHVLRHSLNGTWGDQISPTAIPAGKVFKRTYSYQIPVGKDWKPEHMKVVAYVHKYKSTYEVLNADEAKLMK